MRTTDLTPEKVIKALPSILKEHPEIKVELYQILSKEYVTRAELKEYMERSDKRFNRLIEEMNRRFEEVDRRFDKLIEEMNRRFEEVDRRFNRLIEEMNRRFEEVDRRFEEINQRFEDLQHWVGIVVGGFQRRAGKGLEEAIAGTLRIAIRRPDIKPEKIVLRKRIIDDKGLIGPKGREYEIDLYASDTIPLIFEIKSYAEKEDVERFNDKAELFKKKRGIKKIEKAFITLEKSREIMDTCEGLGIILG